MPVTERDPWAGTGRPAGQRRQPKNTVEHMEAVRPSLIARAKKRRCSRDPWLSNVWSVTGDSKLGDVHHNYEVVLNGKERTTALPHLCARGTPPPGCAATCSR